jgi:hypothetical protein
MRQLPCVILNKNHSHKVWFRLFDNKEGKIWN